MICRGKQQRNTKQHKIISQPNMFIRPYLQKSCTGVLEYSSQENFERLRLYLRTGKDFSHAARYVTADILNFAH